MSAAPATASRERVLDEIRSGERFLLVTHEHPDGDALGSLLGMHGVLRALGKDTVMYLAADDLPLPQEYASSTSRVPCRSRRPTSTTGS